MTDGCLVLEKEIIDCISTCRSQMKNIKTSEIDRLVLDCLVYLVFQNESPFAQSPYDRKSKAKATEEVV